MTKRGLSLAERLEMHSIPEPNSGCLLWTACCPYHGILHYEGSKQPAHRLAWLDARGPIPSGMSVLHKCDTRGCINVDHLFLGTQADNTADMVRKGRQSRGEKRARLFRGERHNNAKLTDEQVRAIRADCRPETQVAPEYGVTRSVIGMIRRRDAWSHVQDEARAENQTAGMKKTHQPEAFPRAASLRSKDAAKTG